MNLTAQYLPYQQIGYFSKLVLDYLEGGEALQPFYAHPVSAEGIKAAIAERKQYPTDRKQLTEVLEKQYGNGPVHEKVRANIDALLSPDTFCVTTAHQPNIFTGHLYFIYKIIHAIRLAEKLRNDIPGSHFVPVFYMGSEDADLEELNHIYINGEEYKWDTAQSGAVGRMKVDKTLQDLIGRISGQLTIYPFGEKLVTLLQDCYREGGTIEVATFRLVNSLFGEYGLLVLLPDDAALKKQFIPIIEKEFGENFSSKAVEETAAAFPKQYKIQAGGREINLFYLRDNIRERIIFTDGVYSVHHTGIRFTEETLREEWTAHPERFSPNVILRPLFQEMILPNIAFIGGGGELAYWLELKKVFEAAGIPYPLLVLRNSYLVAEQKSIELGEKLGFTVPDVFRSAEVLMAEIVKKESSLQLSLTAEKGQVNALYVQLQSIAGAVDVTLKKHVVALAVAAIKKIDALEGKMKRAEKRKFEAQQRQLHKWKGQLLPLGALQERIENFLPYYARWDRSFFDAIHDAALGLEQQFTILAEGQSKKD